MAKTPYVLQALSILGSEQILKLSEVLHAKVPMKMAAGEELIVWDEAPEGPTHGEQLKEAQVLQFPRKSINDFSVTRLPGEGEAEVQKQKTDDSNVKKVMPPDLHLWQREMAKESDVAIQKIDAMKGYQKSTQMYVVKTHTPEGKQKLRFASTNGILVNKKQA